MAMLGAEVYLTDLSEVLELPQHNVDQCYNPTTLHLLQGQGYSRMIPKVVPLKWGEEPLVDVLPQSYDIVVGSDITYNKDACADLLKTLSMVCHQETDLYIGHLERGDEDKFFLDLAKEFDVREVHKEDVSEAGIVKGLWVHIYHAKKKSL